ncbi:peptidyl-prolyl cis-trans isomerase [Photobacterium sp. SDRW27]|uniref:peptidylprolyl isomerase n=1 Tax=Photobacterium obscurum TaxID=2829490 RepID=UPI002242E20D|nr:peptidylprolyl isomerase [Photobacterium obscurum]MCW8329089.1 peptidyl-prolyl cis-trans isomerase [Photobacterium obscurum]
MHCSNSHQSGQEPVTIAEIKVNGEIISEQAIAKELEHHPSSSVAEAIESTSKALVIRELLLQKAKSAGISVLYSEGEKSEEEAINQLLEQQIKLPQINEQQCKDYFYANRDKFCSPVLLEAKHILLLAAPDDEQERAEMKSLAQVLIAILKRSPGKFPDLARQYSACPSKDVGGSLGQVTKGDTVAELEDVMFTAAPGLYEKPISTRFGFHVLYLEHRGEAEPLPFDQVKERIAHYLEQQIYRKSISQFISSLVKQADIDGIEMEV